MELNTKTLLVAALMGSAMSTAMVLSATAVQAASNETSYELTQHDHDYYDRYGVYPERATAAAVTTSSPITSSATSSSVEAVNETPYELTQHDHDYYDRYGVYPERVTVTVASPRKSLSRSASSSNIAAVAASTSTGGVPYSSVEAVNETPYELTQHDYDYYDRYGVYPERVTVTAAASTSPRNLSVDATDANTSSASLPETVRPGTPQKVRSHSASPKAATASTQGLSLDPNAPVLNASNVSPHHSAASVGQQPMSPRTALRECEAAIAVLQKLIVKETSEGKDVSAQTAELQRLIEDKEKAYGKK
ncbi:MAG: hypothetical protein NTX76_02990 [Alphaproteobacteria bacterium]|nr:hypothetical protein [Alphaproteobacteria bacterium]